MQTDRTRIFLTGAVRYLKKIEEKVKQKKSREKERSRKLK